MLRSVTGQEGGRIVKGHPRRHAFGMPEFGSPKKRSITDPILQRARFQGLVGSGGPTGEPHQVSIQYF